MVNDKTIHFREALEICSLEKYYEDYKKMVCTLAVLLVGSTRYSDSYFTNHLFAEYGLKSVSKFLGTLNGLYIISELDKKIKDFCF